MGGYNGLPRKKSLLFSRRRERTRGQILDLTPMGPAADSKPAKRNHPGVRSFDQRPFENSICLIAVGSDRFEKTIDHEIIFKRETEFSSESTFDHCVFDNSQHKHFGNTRAAIFFDHA